MCTSCIYVSDRLWVYKYCTHIYKSHVNLCAYKYYVHCVCKYHCHCDYTSVIRVCKIPCKLQKPTKAMYTAQICTLLAYKCHALTLCIVWILHWVLVCAVPKGLSSLLPILPPSLPRALTVCSSLFLNIISIRAFSDEPFSSHTQSSNMSYEELESKFNCQ